MFVVWNWTSHSTTIQRIPSIKLCKARFYFVWWLLYGQFSRVKGIQERNIKIEKFLTIKLRPERVFTITFLVKIFSCNFTFISVSTEIDDSSIINHKFKNVWLYIHSCKIYQAFKGWSAMLYGSETWCLRENEMTILRRIFHESQEILWKSKCHKYVILIQFCEIS